MTNQKSFREVRDLLQIITDLQARVDVLERARRIGSSSIDGGELLLRGGNVSMRSPSDKLKFAIDPTASALRFYPGDVTDDFILSMFAWQSGDFGAALQLSVDDVDVGSQDGGKLLLMRQATYLSHQPIGGPEAYLSLGEWAQGGIRFKGKFWDMGQYDETDGLLVGKVDIAAGFGAYAHTFSVPFAGIPIIVYGLVSTSGAVTHSITAQSGSGFTVAWSGTTAKTLHFAAFRRQ